VVLSGAALLAAKAKCRVRKRPKLVVLLGAGFSQSLGMPGTDDLTDAIAAFYRERLVQCADDRVALKFERLVSELKTEYRDAYNFEILLEAFESSRQFLGARPTRNASRSPLRPIVDLQAWLGPDALDVLEGMMDTAYVLMRNLLAERQMQIRPDKLEWARAFLWDLAARFDLASINLNYDDVAEQAAPYFFDGFVKSMPDSDGKAFDGRAFENALSSHKLVHLHGSIFFGFNERNGATMQRFPDIESARSKRGWYETEDGGVYSRMISGLKKSEKLLLPPYCEFYRWSTNMLMETPRVLAIGYGVGDRHLNVWLATAALYHGANYRLCFVTKSEDLDAENRRLHGILAIAAGYRYPAEVSSLEALLRFDAEGYAEHRGLAVIRNGFPRSPETVRKIIRFLNS
jgi:hypothetical protein